MVDTSPLAFPVPHCIDGNWNKEPLPEYSGMTLRDFFAAQALAGMSGQCGLFRSGHEETDAEVAFGMALRAYDYADALLKARTDG